MTSTQVKIREIWIPTLPKEKVLLAEQHVFRKEATQLTQQILEQLKTGADFSGLAKKYSQGNTRQQGGILEYLSIDSRGPTFQQTVSKMKIGEVSEMLTFPDGLLIFKLEGMLPAKVKPYQDAKANVEQLAIEYKRKEVEQKITDELLKKHSVKINRTILQQLGISLHSPYMVR